MTGTTKACVIGWPIEHSRSPMIHGHWLELHGIDGSYSKEAVEPAAFETFVRSMPERGFVGGNVTVPHKESLFVLADRREAAAEAVGAANTFWFEADSVCVTNTDTHGFLTNLDVEADSWNAKQRPVVVLGAGGAARAIIHGLVLRGNAIRLLNRTQSRAEEIATVIGSTIEVLPWEERHAALEDCGLVVNTTTLGMSGAEPLDLSLEALPLDAVVTDIVYVPLITDLLARAQLRGNRIVDGLGMLLHQAVPGFEKWFGVRPEVTAELRAMVLRDLGAC